MTLLLGLLSGSGRRTDSLDAITIAAVAGAAFAAAALLFDSTKVASVNSILALLWISAAAVAAVSWNNVTQRILSIPALQVRLRSNTAIYGIGADTEQLVEDIERSDKQNFVGLFEDRATPGRVLPISTPADGGLAEMIDLARRGLIDEVVIALPPSAVERTAAIARQLLQFPVDVRICTAIEAVDIMQLVPISAAPIRDWGMVAKSIEDHILGAIALVFAAPFFALIAIAIKADSAGPVFFRQKRHGVAGNDIVVWKFRTMRVMENGPVVQQATKGDPRVTRVGRILRKTSLDELPQLINVVMGSMSLVGPRPHAIAHNQYYGNVIANYDGRNQVRPGITGWAQINGFRGETQDTEQMARRVDHDIWYISNWSFLLDLKIILLTPFYGLVHKNAY